MDPGMAERSTSGRRARALSRTEVHQVLQPKDLLQLQLGPRDLGPMAHGGGEQAGELPVLVLRLGHEGQSVERDPVYVADKLKRPHRIPVWLERSRRPCGPRSGRGDFVFAELVDIQALLGHMNLAATHMYTHVSEYRMAGVVAKLCNHIIPGSRAFWSCYYE